ERKRRDNINEKIQELGTIIPKTFFEDSKEKSSGTKDGRPNKGQILTKTVEYIKYLQDKIDEQNKLENDLIINLKNLENIKNIEQNSKPSLLYFKNTSAEIALGKIGVGPLAS
ncbi:Rtg1p ASCRUDRAFT_18290, partial [Ascoidea rubescens DSM 1968]